MPLSSSLALAENHSVQLLPGDVITDADALQSFIQSYSRRSVHTIRSYEKECYRFLLWLKSNRSDSPALLPLVSVQDINSYIDFLTNPHAFTESFLKMHGWDHQPFRTALSSESVKHCIVVLYRMFDAMRNLRSSNNAPYCLFNPVVLAHDGVIGQSAKDEVEEALTLDEWQSVLEAIENLPRSSARDVKHYHRSRWIMQLLYRAYLRRDEAAQLKMCSFEPSSDGWNIRLLGKGNKPAKIIATDKLMDELRIYRESFGFTALPSPTDTRPAIMAVTGKDKSVTSQAIYLTVKVLFDLAAQGIEGKNAHSASRLRQATTHWMRHTGITHAMESGISPRYVQAQARHSSLNTTARYDHQDRKAWRVAFERVDS